MKKEHIKTIKKHRKVVMKTCFKMGIFWQGLFHDLSKYSKTEMSIAKWYDGTRSPHDIAREDLGYSPSWYHHKSHNKHHWEYWTDSKDAEIINGEYYIKTVGVKMPYKYVIEMFCDFVGAGKTYNKDKWTTKSPLNYWNKACKNKRVMHEMSESLLENLLITLSKFENEEDFYKWYKENKAKIKVRYILPF